MTTPNAPTPEELAKDIWHDVSRGAFIDARMSSREEAAWKEEACDAIAAAIRQHSAPLDAQIAELQSMLKASSTGEFRATERAEAAEARATQAEAALSAAQERERVMRESLRKCISPFSGYAIQSDSQAVDVMKGFFAHIREVDAIARAALQPQEPVNG